VGLVAAIDVLLRGLGLVCLVAFKKHCTNYRFTARGHDMLATVVRVPELDGTFIEVETMTNEDSTEAAWRISGPFSASWASLRTT
jgi:adenylate cyclase class 2